MVGVMHELAVAEDTVLGRVGADVDVAQRRNKRATGAAEPDERARLGVGEAEFVEIGSETLRYDNHIRLQLAACQATGSASVGASPDHSAQLVGLDQPQIFDD